MIKRSVLLQKVITKTLNETRNISMLAGKIQVQEVVTLRDLRLPEFDKNRQISQQKALGFDNDHVKYDVILGTNILSKPRINLITQKVRWNEEEIASCVARQQQDVQWNTWSLPTLQGTHRIGTQCQACTCSALSGPSYAHEHIQMRIGSPLWKLECLSQHKKVNGPPLPSSSQRRMVNWVGDLHQLNKLIKRDQYLLPIILDILRKLSRYRFFTKLDTSMQYYTFELDEESQDLCTIIALFG
eukprot:CCRYP_016567-RA/>CCRYP_016567-RA protein AED:0.45 eAED:0.45 QI:0/0/0/1/0/0/3/0/242